MTASVCLCVCLSVRKHISGTTRSIFAKFLCMLVVARSSSDGVAICYVLPVLWMTSCFHTMAKNRQLNSDSLGSKGKVTHTRVSV